MTVFDQRNFFCHTKPWSVSESGFSLSLDLDPVSAKCLNPDLDLVHTDPKR
jgi:hypothetical protein